MNFKGIHLICALFVLVASAEDQTYDCEENNPCTVENIEDGNFYFPHHDPDKFVHCDPWSGCYVMPCAPGTEWNQDLLTCDHPRDSGEGGDSAELIPGCIEGTEKITICEDQGNINISCVAGLIEIISGNYGRTVPDAEMCQYGRPHNDDTNCVDPNTEQIIRATCEGLHWCSIPSTNEFFGDPCPDTYKYVEVIYACDCRVPTEPAPTEPPPTEPAPTEPAPTQPPPTQPPPTQPPPTEPPPTEPPPTQPPPTQPPPTQPPPTQPPPTQPPPTEPPAVESEETSSEQGSKSSSKSSSKSGSGSKSSSKSGSSSKSSSKSGSGSKSSSKSGSGSKSSSKSGSSSKSSSKSGSSSKSSSKSKRSKLPMDLCKDEDNPVECRSAWWKFWHSSDEADSAAMEVRAQKCREGSLSRDCRSPWWKIWHKSGEIQSKALAERAQKCRDGDLSVDCRSPWWQFWHNSDETEIDREAREWYKRTKPTELELYEMLVEVIREQKTD